MKIARNKNILITACIFCVVTVLILLGISNQKNEKLSNNEHLSNIVNVENILEIKKSQRKDIKVKLNENNPISLKQKNDRDYDLLVDEQDSIDMEDITSLNHDHNHNMLDISEFDTSYYNSVNNELVITEMDNAKNNPQDFTENNKWVATEMDNALSEETSVNQHNWVAEDMNSN